MADYFDSPMRGVPVVVPDNFDIDDGDCVICGGSLDTGWECNDCGADHMPAVKAILNKRPREPKRAQ